MARILDVVESDKREVYRIPRQPRRWLLAAIGLGALVSTAACSDDGDSNATGADTVNVYPAVGDLANFSLTAIAEVPRDELDPICMIMGEGNLPPPPDEPAMTTLEDTYGRQIRVETDDGETGFVFARHIGLEKDIRVCEVDELTLPTYDDIQVARGDSLMGRTEDLRNALQAMGANYIDHQYKIIEDACDFFEEPADLVDPRKAAELHMYGDFLTVSQLHIDPGAIPWGTALGAYDTTGTIANFCAQRWADNLDSSSGA